MIIEEMARSHYTVDELAHCFLSDIAESHREQFSVSPKLIRHRHNSDKAGVGCTIQWSVGTFSLSRASLTGLVARATGRVSLESAIAKYLGSHGLALGRANIFTRIEQRTVEEGG